MKNLLVIIVALAFSTWAFAETDTSSSAATNAPTAAESSTAAATPEQKPDTATPMKRKKHCCGCKEKAAAKAKS